jgi:hypothetical protein
MDFQTKRKGIHYPSKLRASRVRRGHRAGNRNGGASHGGAARLRGGELVGDCLAVEAGGWRTCTRLGAASHLPLWVGRSGVVAARFQGVAVVRAQAEACATNGEATHTPPTPRGSLYKYQTKRLIKKAVCKLLKTKGRFARGLRGAPDRHGRADQPIHTPHPWDIFVSISKEGTCKKWCVGSD